MNVWSPPPTRDNDHRSPVRASCFVGVPAGQDVTDTFATRQLAESWIEGTLDDGALIANIYVS